MPLSNVDKVMIRRFIYESIPDRDELVRKMNLFYADTNDVYWIIGWKILLQIAENNSHCRTFIGQFPDEFEIHNEIGEYIKEIIMDGINR